MECIIYPDKWCWNTFVKDSKPKVWVKVFVQSLKQIGQICALSSCQNSTRELGMEPSLSHCCSFYDLVLPIQYGKFLTLIFSELELTSSGWEMCVCSSNSCSNFLSSRRDPFSIFAFPILQLEIFQFMIGVAFTFLCICVFVFVRISSSGRILPANLRLYGVSVLWSVWLLVEAFYRDAMPRWACSWKK